MRMLAHSLPILFALAATAGCAAMQMTVAQELAWERWAKCNHFPTITLKEVRTDGTIWVYTQFGSDLAAWQACDKAAREEQGARRVAVSGSLPTAATAAPSADVTARARAVRVGSEWAFRWESPQGKGTFVYVLDREEIRDGATWYVLKSGTRELYYRKDDLAIALDVLDGNPDIRRTPPIQLFKWPLAVGQEWEQAYTVERPKDRQTDEIQAVCKTEKEETIVVPAGAFRTFKVRCQNKRTGAMMFELWYAPEVGFYVRELSSLRTGGTRERELIQYRLR